jgi:hypothetical protein
MKKLKTGYQFIDIASRIVEQFCSAHSDLTYQMRRSALKIIRLNDRYV